ncbi:MAG: aminotransferase class III-fold pyridoxal phosphate-dependent enzyme [Bacteroidetes bacterium]|nr:MAG: aminotransferase class III-fold pyridoxal phosphate-dependent enzyme [Bacteroidota bacterium]REK05737.1 MAG: aminotransferase class III-fold pyridoxal phosphate-dependent enzyme [Bacteroidota bacterium]REK31957.1 MAG: aminotransferase class III-fold pyridoxal phosphate-dependent enzyme [Bacteroidota bacterium]REK50022.1 MAG: aminotransferase class III-fold pyridoxal phosphate-dependent enzyme [Bacteroidota bacterium]
MSTSAQGTLSLKDEILQTNLKHSIFSWTKQSGINPLNIEKAKGVYLYERSGKRILDFSSQLMNVNIGHGHPAVTEAVMKQMNEVSYVHPGMITEARGKLSQKLSEISPGTLNRAFYTNGGADAIENAIKLARLYTGRHKIISLYQSYHGATYGALSAGGDPRGLSHDSQGVPNIIHAENPYFYRCPWNSRTPEECAENAAAHMERLIKYEGPQYVAAILMEGESGSSGCIKYPPGYWKKVSDIAAKYGILTICDEVMSGFCRTGKWFGIEHHGVEPDIMCMAKGITSGYIPLGGMMVKEEIIKHFDDKPLPLGLTYSAHAVACAAANAVIEVYEKENLMENAAKMGRYMDESAARMMDKHPSIGDFRNTGLLGVFELVKNRKTKEPMAPWNAGASEMEVMNKVAAKLTELGLFTFVRWNWIFTAPPLCITKEQIDEGLDMISKAISIADEYCN